MAHSYNRLHTQHTPQQAFDFVSDLRHAALWDPRTQSVTLQTDGPVQLGSRFLLKAKLFFGLTLDLPYEIVSYERPHQLVLAGSTPLLEYREQITFRADSGAGFAGGTVIEYEARMCLRKLLALGNPILSLFYQRIGDDATSGIVPALDKSLAN